MRAPMIPTLALACALPFAAIAQEAPTAPSIEAQQGAATDALFEVLLMDEMIALMAAEGLEYGDDIEAAMFPEGGGQRWDDTVARIYDPARMGDMVQAEFASALSEAQTDLMLAFFQDGPGAQAVDLELSARRAMLDDAIEEAAREAAAEALANKAPRIAQIEAFIEANDLIERNVVGAMNSNYAFYQGLSLGQGLPFEMSEEDILSDVWASEPQVRADSQEWLYAFLNLAYKPLSDSDLDAYTAFFETEAGRDLTEASFAAYNAMFDDLSKALGAAAAQFAQGQDI